MIRSAKFCLTKNWRPIARMSGPVLFKPNNAKVPNPKRSVIAINLVMELVIE